MCLLQVTLGMWLSPTRHFGILKLVSVPVEVLLPILFAFGCSIRLEKMTYEGAMSKSTAERVKSIFWLFAAVVYLPIMDLLDLYL